jgi:predicted GIY-YIG superfamily endonuclease
MWAIYIITNEHGRLKIGIAVDVWRRLRRLQIGSADLLTLACFFVMGIFD